MSLKCAVCENDSDVVVSLPVVQATLIKWSEILNCTSLLTAPRYKKICLNHFAEKWHKALKNPACRRSSYCFPLPYHRDSVVDSVSIPIPNNSSDFVPDCASNSVEVSHSSSVHDNKRSISPIPDEHTLHNRCKKPVDADLVIQMRDEEINDLKSQIKDLKLEVAAQNRKLNEKIDLQKIAPHLIDESGLGQNSKAMLSLLLSKNVNRLYTKPEKDLCQSIYYKKPGSYNHLRQLLDRKLPSARTLIRWHVLKDLNVGVVKPVLNYLVSKRSELNEADKELVLIVDEMDGKRDLIYDKSRDMIVGFEEVFERKPKLAKKFLSIIIRGVNDSIDNLVLANYATANGITGSFLIL